MYRTSILLSLAVATGVGLTAVASKAQTTGHEKADCLARSLPMEGYRATSEFLEKDRYMVTFYHAKHPFVLRKTSISIHPAGEQKKIIIHDLDGDLVNGEKSVKPLARFHAQFLMGSEGIKLTVLQQNDKKTSVEDMSPASLKAFREISDAALKCGILPVRLELTP